MMNKENMMETNEHIITLGTFESQQKFEETIEALRDSGFRNSDISSVLPPNSMSKEAMRNETKAPEGAASGVVTGVALGGILGWLAGIGTLVVPGVGALIAAGPIMAALTGAGVGGVVGGVTGTLVGFGIPEYEAKLYEKRLKEGAFLLSVHCDNEEWSKKARLILEDKGARDINSTHEAFHRTPRSDIKDFPQKSVY
jgi:hypothetical protein